MLKRQERENDRASVCHEREIAFRQSCASSHQGCVRSSFFSSKSRHMSGSALRAQSNPREIPHQAVDLVQVDEPRLRPNYWILGLSLNA